MARPVTDRGSDSRGIEGSVTCAAVATTIATQPPRKLCMWGVTEEGRGREGKGRKKGTKRGRGLILPYLYPFFLSSHFLIIISFTFHSWLYSLSQFLPFSTILSFYLVSCFVPSSVSNFFHFFRPSSSVRCLCLPGFG